MTDLILTSTTPLTQLRQQGGGKATNLARMELAGCCVPSWFCVGVEAFDRFVRENALEPYLVPQGDLAAWEQEVERQFLSHPLPAKLESTLAKALEGSGCVAVRSSGLDEDGSDHSFAGQFSSFLFQRGVEEVSRSLRRCWASGFTERGISYRRERGLQIDRIQVGVVIQQMVDADVAGVGFSRNPTSPLDRESVVLSAVWGVGEGLVSGALDADTFIYNRKTGEISSDIVCKKEAFRRDPEGGVRPEALDEERHDAPSLTDGQVKEISEQLMLLEQTLGSAQDVEWAIREGSFYLLQTRPITTLPREPFFDPAINGGGSTLWDNSNIIESYSGVTSPLTFSFASYAYQQVYIQFCEVMGVPQQVIDKQQPMFRNMLGLLRGNIYYNLVNWYKLIALLPGASNSASFMETMMGVQKGLDEEQSKLFDFADEIPHTSWLKKLRLYSLTFSRFRRMDTIAEEFFDHFNPVYEAHRKITFSEKSLQELKGIYEHLSDQILRRWQAPIINDYLCMLFFGLLKKLTRKWVGDSEDVASLQNDLLCGQGGVESTEPTKMLMRIAASIDQGEERVRRFWLESSSEQIWNTLRDGLEYPELSAQVLEFLDRYGFRCVNELKLEERDLHDDPSFVIEAISSYVRTKSYSVEQMEAKERQICEKAEGVINQKLSGVKRRVYYWVLFHARRAVRHRENLRFARTKIFGVVRHLFRGMGTQLQRLGALESAEDVFYFSVEELIAYIEGRSLTGSLKDLAALRRAEFDAYRASPPPPDRLFTRGGVGVSLLYPQVLADGDLLRDHLPVSDDPNTLIGTPCCPGKIEGVVRVVHSLDDARGLDGEILVTARTDPGWVPLYPSCSGLLIERGSLLSHSAVVARELGVPTIVGISGGLMEKLKSGDRVQIDAAKGEVRILGCVQKFK